MFWLIVSVKKCIISLVLFIECQRYATVCNRCRKYRCEQNDSLFCSEDACDSEKGLITSQFDMSHVSCSMANSACERRKHGPSGECGSGVMSELWGGRKDAPRRGKPEKASSPVGQQSPSLKPPRS